MERQRLLDSELQVKMTLFAMRLESFCRGVVTSMMTRWGEKFEIALHDSTYLDGPQTNLLYMIQCQLTEMTQRWSRLSAEASQIAAQVKELKLTEVDSVNSWSVIPGNDGLTEDLEVRSVASDRTVASQASCLSGHSPHCFLPRHLFKTAAEDSKYVSAKDLQVDSKILAADGDTIQVEQMEKHKTTNLFELMILDAEPLTVTPNHRIVTSPDGTTVMARDLKVGKSLVMCSDLVAKMVVGMRLIPVEEQEVISITFHPDKAVACFLPLEQPMVLTKGRTPKPTRRGGMGRRGAKHEVMSIPDTAAGEYED